MKKYRIKEVVYLKRGDLKQSVEFIIEMRFFFFIWIVITDEWESEKMFIDIEKARDFVLLLKKGDILLKKHRYVEYL